MDNYETNNNCQLPVVNCQFNKEQYRILCQTEETIPIFSRDWWLDIVCGEKYWDVLIIEEKDKIVAALPLFIPYSKVISMPPYTQTMGPWFAFPSEPTKQNFQQAYRQNLCKLFLEKLKAYPFFFQNFHYTITDWLPFYWEHYKQTTRYTYLLENIENPDKIWSNMSGGLQRSIKTAKKNKIEVRRGIPLKDLLIVLEKTFSRQALSLNHIEILKNIIQICQQKKQGDIWGGYDTDGHLHAAVFVAWQKSSAYYLAGGGDPVFRKSCAHSLVLWESIQTVKDHTSKFDFEGSMLPGVEYFFRGFGGKQIPYFAISKGKMSLLYKAWLKIRGRITR